MLFLTAQSLSLTIQQADPLFEANSVLLGVPVDVYQALILPVV
jgi:hypothetical protein